VLPGSLVIAVLRQILHMPAFRYVDDVFGPEREGSAAHAEQIVARVVKCLLGPTAISSHKVAHGNPLVVLGVEATIEEEGMSFRPSADKVAKWTRQLKEALASGKLYGGEASKMCGRLQWAASHTFKRIGRAMLRPFYAQIKKRTAEIDVHLATTIEWWIEVLQEGLCERRAWQVAQQRPIYMYCDARSTPPRAAAVIAKCAALHRAGRPGRPHACMCQGRAASLLRRRAVRRSFEKL